MPHQMLSFTADAPLTLDPSNPSFTVETAPARFKLGGIAYVRESEVVNGVRAPKKKSAACWLFGEVLRRNDNKMVYYCYDYERRGFKQKLFIINGATGAREHMARVHRRDPDTGKEAEALPKKQQQSFFELVDRKDYDVFKALLMRWIVFCQLAFFMLENTLFRDLIQYLNASLASLASLLPKARSTLRAWMMGEYLLQKSKIVEELKISRSRIHLSFDIWTAPSYISIISVWGYWLDCAGQRQRRLLAFRRIFGSHSGENQAEVLLAVIKEYEIEAKIGYLISDNASSNDSATKLVLQQLFPDLPRADVVARRLRCFGHVVNLSAKCLLSASDSEVRCACEEVELADLEWEEGARSWVHGPVSKLHRIVKYVLASPQRREEFAAIAGPRDAKEYDHLGLLQDNVTRWSSHHTAIGRALDVKERIDRFIRSHKPDKDAKYRPQQDKLSADDWRFLERLHDTLDAFFFTTKTTESHNALITSWFQTLHFLLNEIDAWKQEAEADSDQYLATFLAATWNKIEKYYKLADSSPVYYAAIVLNPSLKMHWFRQEWTTDDTAPWIPQTEERVRHIWRTQYKSSNTTPKSTRTPSRDGIETALDRLNSVKRLRLDRSLAPALNDQLDQYLATDPTPLETNDAVLQYWIDREATQPQLAQFAFDTFSIPLMTSDNERSFSSGRDMITYRRTRLLDDIIEACQCLKSWLQHPVEADFDENDYEANEMPK